MLSGDLQTKLQKLNPRIFILKGKAAVEGEWRYSGIYLREAGKKQTMAKWKWSYADTGAQKHLEDLEKGTKDKFLCGVSLTVVPEYDIFNLDRGLVLAPGWRSILLSLAKLKAIDIRKARRVFSASSLGRQTYDRMSLEQKIAWVSKENKIA
jgi:hypothetical protein